MVLRHDRLVGFEGITLLLLVAATCTWSGTKKWFQLIYQSHGFIRSSQRARCFGGLSPWRVQFITAICA